MNLATTIGERNKKLVWAFVGHTFHIVGNLISQLILIFLFLNQNMSWVLKRTVSFEYPKHVLKLVAKKIIQFYAQKSAYWQWFIYNLSLWVLGLAVSNINESQLQT